MQGSSWGAGTPRDQPTHGGRSPEWQRGPAHSRGTRLSAHPGWARRGLLGEPRDVPAGPGVPLTLAALCPSINLLPNRKRATPLTKSTVPAPSSRGRRGAGCATHRMVGSG